MVEIRGEKTLIMRRNITAVLHELSEVEVPGKSLTVSCHDSSPLYLMLCQKQMLQSDIKGKNKINKNIFLIRNPNPEKDTLYFSRDFKLVKSVPFTFLFTLNVVLFSCFQSTSAKYCSNDASFPELR